MVIGLCLPLAVLIGFFLAEPFRLGSIAILAMVAFVLTFPLVIRWHHPLLILSWNAAITPVFLPGRPDLWMLMAGVSFGVAVLNRAVSERHPFRHVPSVSSSLLALVGVVLLTAAVTGGLGMRSFGSETYGGKRYFYIIAAAIGYFALGNTAIRPERRQAYIAMFFLGGLTYLLSNVAYSAGQSFWWMFYFLPGEFALEQARGDMALDRSIVRLTSLYPASLALYAWLLARYGLLRIFVWQRPWRMGLFFLAWAACIYSGFRSAFVLLVLLTLCQFFFEGLHRTRILAVALGGVLVVGGLVVGFAERMPMVVQRTISFLPVNVDPVARSSAQVSTEWRLNMWRDVLPEVPRYLFKGKGYAMDPNQQVMAMESAARGYGGGYQAALTAGDYHNGPLSVIIPFGLWGVGAFLWFLGASLYYLYGNYRYGDPALRLVNTLLLALFVSRTVFFLLVYGAFNSNLVIFTGIVGFAVALNGKPKQAVRAIKPIINLRDVHEVEKDKNRPSGAAEPARHSL